MRENTDQKNFEYGHFSYSANLQWSALGLKVYAQKSTTFCEIVVYSAKLKQAPSRHFFSKLTIETLEQVVKYVQS